jgi:hypothetical protein
MVMGRGHREPRLDMIKVYVLHQIEADRPENMGILKHG